MTTKCDTTIECKGLKKEIPITINSSDILFKAYNNHYTIKDYSHC